MAPRIRTPPLSMCRIHQTDRSRSGTGRIFGVKAKTWASPLSVRP